MQPDLKGLPGGISGIDGIVKRSPSAPRLDELQGAPTQLLGGNPVVESCAVCSHLQSHTHTLSQHLLQHRT